VSIVKSLGVICTDRKKFEQFLKTLYRDVFKEYSVFDYTVMDSKGDLRKIDNITSEAFLHKFNNIEEVILPTLNVYYLLHLANIALLPNDFNANKKYFENLNLLKSGSDQRSNLLVVGPRANAKTLTVCKGMEILADT